MLDPWITARGRWKKALARSGYERRSWRAARAFHALTADEARDIERSTGHGEIVVIPNAGPPVAAPDAAPRALHIVCITRIHPKKNLGALVTAWRQAARPSGSRLTIAGWGDPRDVAALMQAIGTADDGIAFIGPVHGAAKQALLASARFVVLPSLSEGLPMAILEGWAAGAPTIMTPACHLPQGCAAGAALETGPDSAALSKTLSHALACDEAQWQAMAQAARSLAAGPFARDTVAACWARAYRTLSHGEVGP